MSVHYRLPFGSIASVHGWDRIGEPPSHFSHASMFLDSCSYIPGSLLCALGRKVLMIPLSRYVDDFYSADRADCAKSAMACFVRYALRDLRVHVLVS